MDKVKDAALEPKPKKLKAVPRASELAKASCDRWNAIQRVDTGLIIGAIGAIGPSEDRIVGFVPDGGRFVLSAEALREIADLIDLHGLELDS